MIFNKTSLGLIGAALLSASPLASAHEAGDWLVRVGGSQLDPTSNNGDIVDVDSESSITFNVAYMFTERWGLELLASTPFEHAINLIDGPRVGSTKHLPPTLNVQFHLAPNADFQPYVGAGVNYTYFYDEETTGPLAGSNLELDNSVGLGVQAGIDWMLGDKWFLNVDVRWISIETDATLDGEFLEEVSIDPMIYGAHLGYRF